MERETSVTIGTHERREANVFLERKDKGITLLTITAQYGDRHAIHVRMTPEQREELISALIEQREVA
jgi:hypothetical protein